jgi:large subunit ribosomal protein L33
MVKRGISLQCTKCNEINYITRKNSKKHPDRIELSKFCSSCRAATTHKETKKK